MDWAVGCVCGGGGVGGGRCRGGGGREGVGGEINKTKTA